MAKRKSAVVAAATAPAELKVTPTTRKIEVLARNVATSAKAHRDPFLDIPVRSLSNVKFDRRRKIIEMGDRTQRRLLFDLKNARSFMQTMLVAAACKEAVEQGITTSIRDIFYHCKHTIKGSVEETFVEQSESDDIIEDLEVTLDSLREELGLHAEQKGQMVGPMTIVDSGNVIDLTRLGSGGWGVPSIVEPDMIQFRKCDAEFVLLIEKGAVWGRFNQDRFWEKQNCIIIHGGGQPPRGVRRLCYRMCNELKIPLYVLVDNDPWGYYIYSVVKQGSINLAYESKRMPIPSARFIGMSSFDKDKFKLPDNVVLALKKEDVSRAEEIMQYPWFVDKKHWQDEIRHMLKTGVKLELEALSAKNFRFITETYLPQKIKDRDWLD
jgi:DNA topoisomerase-6 subunit A